MIRAAPILVLLTGCTTVLGIDGEYLPYETSASISSASSGGAGAGATGGAGGEAANGGAGGMAGAGPACPQGLAGPSLVAVGTFCIDSTEVTRGQYAEWLARGPQIAACPVQNPGYAPHKNGPLCRGDSGVLGFACSDEDVDLQAEPDLPVVCIEWCDARDYCAWAGKHLCGALGGGGPSDYGDVSGEWYHACTNADTTSFPYGTVYVKKSCVDNQYDGILGLGANDRALPVGTEPKCRGSAAPFDGVYDLNGNVAEWEDKCAGDDCRIRGGSFGDDTEPTGCNLQGGAPDPMDSDFMDRDGACSKTGFRCCADLAP